MAQTMTRITTPFGFGRPPPRSSPAIDLSGKRAIVTGAASGIGVETARALAGAGAEVTLAVRDTDAGERTAADITATTGNTALHVGRLDLADQASVAAFVAGWSGPLHMLVNNAGVMALPELQLTRKAGRCSSRPTTSVISRSRSACTTRSPRRATRGSCR